MKKIIVILLAMLTAFSVAACNGNPDTDIDPTDNTRASTVSEDDKLFAVETEYGAVMYPEIWQQRLETYKNIEGDMLIVTFTTKLDSEIYYLFKVIISSDDGDTVGRITDRDGKTRNVFIDVYDLGDISELSAEDQNILYAMQEGVNVVIENLEPVWYNHNGWSSIHRKMDVVTAFRRMPWGFVYFRVAWGDGLPRKLSPDGSDDV